MFEDRAADGGISGPAATAPAVASALADGASARWRVLGVPGAGDGHARHGRLVVLGGTSEIAEAIVRELAARQPREVVLVGRDAAGLRATAARLEAGGAARVRTLGGLDADDAGSHRAILARAFALLGEVDTVIVAVGSLGERGGLPQDIAAAVEVLRVNVLLAGSLLMESVRALRARGGGTVVVLSSLAAERPRRANAVYSASKAALDGLSAGLADDLVGSGVRIMVVRPGFVRTRMTRGLPTPPLSCSSAQVAAATVRGLDRGAQVVWAPSSLRWVGLAMRLMPRGIFRRLSL